MIKPQNNQKVCFPTACGATPRNLASIIPLGFLLQVSRRVHSLSRKRPQLASNGPTSSISGLRSASMASPGCVSPRDAPPTWRCTAESSSKASTTSWAHACLHARVCADHWTSSGHLDVKWTSFRGFMPQPPWRWKFHGQSLKTCWEVCLVELWPHPQTPAIIGVLLW